MITYESISGNWWLSFTLKTKNIHFILINNIYIKKYYFKYFEFNSSTWSTVFEEGTEMYFQYLFK